jgi:transcriptional regulator of heat shock response
MLSSSVHGNIYCIAYSKKRKKLVYHKRELFYLIFIIMDANDKKLLEILWMVIDTYINKGEPIWSKYLHTLEDIGYAPSTIRKYLNILEKDWYVYQPYNSSWRIPTVSWMAIYLDSFLEDTSSVHHDIDIDIELARWSMQQLIDYLSKIIDGVSVWFLRNDEYYYLGINNLLKNAWLTTDVDVTRRIVEFIETREIIWFLSTKVIKRRQVYYTFITDNEMVFSCLYTKVTINDFEAIISIVWPMRVNYKKNLAILQKIVQMIT